MKDASPPRQFNSAQLPGLSRTFSSSSLTSSTSLGNQKVLPLSSPTLATLTSRHTSPTVTPNSILFLGLIAFFLARVWTPILLIIAYILSLFIPNAFRVNDDGETRRKLWKEFVEKCPLPEKMKCRDVNLEESYWVNDR